MKKALHDNRHEWKAVQRVVPAADAPAPETSAPRSIFDVGRMDPMQEAALAVLPHLGSEVLEQCHPDTQKVAANVRAQSEGTGSRVWPRKRPDEIQALPAGPAGDGSQTPDGDGVDCPAKAGSVSPQAADLRCAIWNDGTLEVIDGDDRKTYPKHKARKLAEYFQAVGLTALLDEEAA
jgi:hypothetical protein